MKICFLMCVAIALAMMASPELMRQRSARAFKVLEQPGKRDGQLEWRAGSYRGLRLGRSTETDVMQVFGRPAWKGPPEEKLIDSDPEMELLLEYRNVGGVKGRTTIVIDARTRIVKAIDVYPEHLTRGRAISLFGGNYVVRDEGLGPCPREERIKQSKPSAQRKYPIWLVYARRGLYVSVNKDDTVLEIGYLARCP
ncbi:MAG: hypothetical protein AABN33_24260 [Acidobacteriota bacterium]